MKTWVPSRKTDIVATRDGTGQHFCSPARPELTKNRPAQPVYAKLQLIF